MKWRLWPGVFITVCRSEHVTLISDGENSGSNYVWFGGASFALDARRRKQTTGQHASTLDETSQLNRPSQMDAIENGNSNTHTT